MVGLGRVDQEGVAEVVDIARKDAPCSPYGSRTDGTSRWEPTRMRVGASVPVTSLNRNSINRARSLERRLVWYIPAGAPSGR